MTDDIERSHRESAELLGFDFDRLTPASRLKVELASALRAAVDDQLARITRSNAGDIGKLCVAVEQLTNLMKASPSAATEVDEDDDGEDPRESLMRIIDGWIEADEQKKAERAAERREKGLGHVGTMSRLSRLSRSRVNESRRLLSPEVEKIVAACHLK